MFCTASLQRIANISHTCYIIRLYFHRRWAVSSSEEDTVQQAAAAGAGESRCWEHLSAGELPLHAEPLRPQDDGVQPRWNGNQVSKIKKYQRWYSLVKPKMMYGKKYLALYFLYVFFGFFLSTMHLQNCTISNLSMIKCRWCSSRAIWKSIYA